MNITARVAIISGILSFTIRKELMTATVRQARMVSTMEVPMDMLYQTNMVIIKVSARLAVAPTARSMPFTVRE